MKNKIYYVVINGQSDNNIRYADFQNLIIDLGFIFERQKGSHVIYYHNGIGEFMNIQPDGNKAKGYQVRQLRGIIMAHGL
ncbi:MAG: type II toxin-antitoxin system HicA family toxin [Defluviitaleaceae bacterium]|nr:type II toxin-antitoxin system HicA family toxin [Defluviitaleaceae bacterium]MCL2239010.1 type II toxin-antitoxin system HicA family toxin [Defluviitaleaceae bacterium]